MAKKHPELAALSLLAHGESPGGRRIAEALRSTAWWSSPEEAAYYNDPIYVIAEAVNMELKDLLPENYRPSERALRSVAALRQAYEEGLEEGREEGLSQGREEGRSQGREGALREALHRLVESRLGSVPAQIARRIEACHETGTLFGWLAGVGRAADNTAVKAVFETEGFGTEGAS